MIDKETIEKIKKIFFNEESDLTGLIYVYLYGKDSYKQEKEH